MNKISVALGIVLLLAGMLLAIFVLEDFASFAFGILIAFVGFILLLTGARTGRSVGFGERKGGLQGVVRNLRREGNVVNFWLEVSGQAGRTVPVEAYLSGDTVGEGDTVWVGGKAIEGGKLHTSEVQNLTRMQGTSGFGSPQINPSGGGLSGVVRVLLIIGWLILSLILSLLTTIAVAESGLLSGIFSEGQEMEMASWGVFFVTFVILQVIMYASGALSGKKQVRITPIGVSPGSGGFDPQAGILEATARNVSATPDTRISEGVFWKAKMNRVLRFRAELTDAQGNIVQYVPVEIECEERKWVGQISDGDKIRVQGKYGADGILHSEKALNLTTKSFVGKK